MPYGMSDHIQSVLIEETVYVGGGFASPQDRCNVVLVYDIASGNWAELPPYENCYFGMSKIDNQLVLVGGWKDHVRSKKLGVLKPRTTSWSHPYPDMPTARSDSSVISYAKWLIVAGGDYVSFESISVVEVMDTETRQWQSAPSIPITWARMRTAIVNDTCYFLGGYSGRDLISHMYSVSLPDLVSQLDSTQGSDDVWKELTGPALTLSSPLSISGSLFAMGGSHAQEVTDTVSAIHLYQPTARVWVKVGDMPTSRCTCSCIATSENEILMAGGCDPYDRLIKLDIASMK